jgi:hypothetical protein
MRKWRRTHLTDERRQWAQLTRRTHKHAGKKVSITVEELLELLGDSCPICESRFVFHARGKEKIYSPTADRIDNNGPLSIKNTQVICLLCNTRKGSKEVS